MLHPSYMELIDHINKVNSEMGNAKINSRYSLVMAASKRARALIDKENAMIVDKYNGRMLSMAIAEMEAEKVGVITREPSQEEMETVGFDEMAVVDLTDKFDEE